jgi:hypothetical protein
VDLAAGETARIFLLTLHLIVWIVSKSKSRGGPPYDDRKRANPRHRRCLSITADTVLIVSI